MTHSHTPTTRALERFLAVVATAVCLIVCVRIWHVLSVQQPMWPLPGLYLLEMVVVSLIGLFGILRRDSEQPALAGALTWAVAGVFTAFVVMGAWSIGILFIPVALIFLIAAMLGERGQRRKLIVHLCVYAIAAFAQVGLMLAVIRVVYPDPVS